MMYATIPIEALLAHMCRINMPTCLLNVIKAMHHQDEHILINGHNSARVWPTWAVKQGCPLSLLLFSLYIK